jgi:hypothetical protein
MKNINLKNLPSALRELLGAIGSKINLNTWYFTITFFLFVFGVSIWVWWNCIQDPHPSNDVLIRVEQGKVNYKEMKTSTEQVIAILQESRDRFENPPFFGNQRELFMDVDLEESEGEGAVISRESEEPSEEGSLTEELGIEQGPESEVLP